jgi:hypothetical protein
MELPAPVKDKMNAKSCWMLFLFALIWAGIAPAAGRAAQPSPPDQRVSVSVKSRPLGEVLDKITRETGRVFVMDSAWRSHSVTVSFEDTPLSQALKRILEGLNSAIIFQRDTSIRLVIIDNPPAGAGAAAGAPGAPPPRASLRKPIDRGPIAPARGSIPSMPETPAPMPQAESAPPNPAEGKMEDGDE